MTYQQMLPIVVAKIDTSRGLLELQYMFKPRKNTLATQMMNINNRTICGT